MRRVSCRGCATLVLSLLLVLFGCGEPSAPDAPEEATRPASEEGPQDLRESEIQALEALGYVDSATVDDELAASGVLTRTDDCECDSYLLVTYPPMRRADLMNRDGRVLRTWEGPEDKNWERATFTPDGDVLVVGYETLSTGKDGSELNRRLLAKLSWDGALIWRRDLPVHHVAFSLPDGRITTLTSRARIIPGLVETYGDRWLADNGVALTTPDAIEILEERSIYDALASRPDLFRFRVERMKDGTPSRDLLHTNSAEWMPGGELALESPLFGTGNVLVTVRSQDTVAIFNFERSELLWAWGAGELIGMHDAKLVGDGHILIFDNRTRGLEETGEGWSRIVEVDPVTDEIVWEYRADPPEDFYSYSRGTAHRLSGGNTLIASSNQGRIFEVTPDGEVAWDYWTPHKWGESTRSVLRAEVYSREFVETLLDR